MNLTLMPWDTNTSTRENYITVPKRKESPGYTVQKYMWSLSSANLIFSPDPRLTTQWILRDVFFSESLPLQISEFSFLLAVAFYVSVDGTFPTLASFCPVHWAFLLIGKKKKKKKKSFMWLFLQWPRVWTVSMLGCSKCILGIWMWAQGGLQCGWSLL